jgi:hypothetical protein
MSTATKPFHNSAKCLSVNEAAEYLGAVRFNVLNNTPSRRGSRSIAFATKT